MTARDAKAGQQSLPARRGRLALVAGLIALLWWPPAVNAAPLENAGEIGPALLRCWRPPSAPDGSAVTLRFSFRRDGSLISARITYVGVAGAAKLKREFANSAVGALGQCSPLDLAPRLAATIGGKVYVMQFAIRRKQPTVRQMFA